jgi:hypothetical protein
MKSSDPDMQADTETLEHLLGVVVENREKRCQAVRDRAFQQASEITGQAYQRGRARLHRHVNELREECRLKVTSATARNQTLLRQQRHKEERAILDVAWPMLRTSMMALWQQYETRCQWIESAIETAKQRLRQRGWRIEHPPDFSEDDRQCIEQMFTGDHKPELSASDDIEAGIRIRLDGAVIDATLAGLLRQKRAIEARMIARIKQGAMSHE